MRRTYLKLIRSNTWTLAVTCWLLFIGYHAVRTSPPPLAAIIILTAAVSVTLMWAERIEANRKALREARETRRRQAEWAQKVSQVVLFNYTKRKTDPNQIKSFIDSLHEWTEKNK